MTILIAFERMWQSNSKKTIGWREMGDLHRNNDLSLLNEIFKSSGPCVIGCENGHSHFLHVPDKFLFLTLKGKRRREVEYGSFRFVFKNLILSRMQESLERS